MVNELERALSTRIEGDVRFDAGTRAAYSTDASNYRDVPLGVVAPRTVEEGAAALRILRDHGATITSRGGGTSLAGQATNTGVIVDWSKYCTRLVSVDADRRTCVVEPGIVLDDLNRQLAPHGLELGPRPSTHSHCTIGGMIGNNACGATAQRTGTTSDNVVRLEIQLYDGTRMWVGATPSEEHADAAAGDGSEARLLRRLGRLRDDHLVAPRLGAGAVLDGLEPSCTAVFRADAPELLDAVEDGWQPPATAVDVLSQTHCHQHAVLGTAADDRLLDAMGARLQPMAPDAVAWPAISRSSPGTTRCPPRSGSASSCPRSGRPTRATAAGGPPYTWPNSCTRGSAIPDCTPTAHFPSASTPSAPDEARRSPCEHPPFPQAPTPRRKHDDDRC